MTQRKVDKDISRVNWLRFTWCWLLVSNSERNGENFARQKIKNSIYWLRLYILTCFWSLYYPEFAVYFLCACIMLRAILSVWLCIFLHITFICANLSCFFFLFITPLSTRLYQSTNIIIFFIDRKPKKKEKQKQTYLTQLTHLLKLFTFAQLVLTEEKKEINS